MGWSTSKRIKVRNREREKDNHLFSDEFFFRLMIRMKNLINNNIWYWDDTKFFNRSYIIKVNMNLLEKKLLKIFFRNIIKNIWMEKKEFYILRKKMIRKKGILIAVYMIYVFRFWEPVEDVLIGTANVFLQNLAYLLDFDDETSIVDYKASIVSP
jgi:hypothetical protein